jgi:hypothetical protein
MESVPTERNAFLELVGRYAHSGEKFGRDVGELVAREPRRCCGRRRGRLSADRGEKKSQEGRVKS